MARFRRQTAYVPGELAEFREADWPARCPVASLRAWHEARRAWAREHPEDLGDPAEMAGDELAERRARRERGEPALGHGMGGECLAELRAAAARRAADYAARPPGGNWSPVPGPPPAGPCWCEEAGDE